MATVNGTNSSETLNGLDGVTNGNDTIWGYGGDDTIFGLGGNDIIHGGSGADHIDGGAGFDTSSYSDSTSGVIVNLASGSGDYGYAQGDTLTSIEGVIGSWYRDILVGNNGDNFLSGLGGNDVIIGGGGDDSLWGGDGLDSLDGGDGVDTLKGGGGADVLKGGDDNDLLYGGDGVDTLQGGYGDDMLDGGTDDDTMFGGVGNDIYFVDSASDRAAEYAGEGTDTVYSSAHSYTLAAFVENLSLDSGSGSAVYGTGNDLGNTIYGNAGSNTLNGGAGADSINGLGGNDTFAFHAGEANGDTLYEFDGNGLGAGDVLYFVGYGSVAEGATFLQLDATSWEITSADGTIHDIIYLAGAPTVDATDFSFY